jgi:hypothetical protein
LHRLKVGPAANEWKKEKSMKRSTVKKLTLSRETLRELSNVSLAGVVGGGDSGVVGLSDGNCTESALCYTKGCFSDTCGSTCRLNQN